MTSPSIQPVLTRVVAPEGPSREDLIFLLNLKDPCRIQELFDRADQVRRQYVGDEILLRGIVEFSNHCRNDCAYCGISRSNRSLARYRMTQDQVLASVQEIALAGIKTVVLQSGEDPGLDPHWLAHVIQAIKSDFDMAVTLSVGERPEADYRLWRQAGADRYLLKIETTNPRLYDRLHPGMSLDRRTRCSQILRELGYQNGSGSLVGLEGQSLEDLADDLLFFRQFDFDMVGIGVFIPHDRTPLAGRPVGDLGLALRMVALTRILLRDSHIPATTAIGTVGDGLGQEQALKAGANVVMPNFTPSEYRLLYDIYPGRRGVDQSPGETVDRLRALAESMGRTIGLSKGDSLKGNRPGRAHESAVYGRGARGKKQQARAML